MANPIYCVADFVNRFRNKYPQTPSGLPVAVFSNSASNKDWECIFKPDIGVYVFDKDWLMNPCKTCTCWNYDAHNRFYCYTGRYDFLYILHKGLNTLFGYKRDSTGGLVWIKLTTQEIYQLAYNLDLY